MNNHQAVFVAFEGIDNAGKTTLIEGVKTALSPSFPVFVTKELTTEVGKLLLSRLASHDVDIVEKTLLFAADRQERLRRYFSANLAEKALCIADRWVLSAIAYRSAEDSSISSYVESVNRVFPTPDVSIIIDIPADVSLAREKSPNGRNYSRDYLEKVRSSYLEIAKVKNLTVIDGTCEYDVVQNRVLEKTSATLT